MTKKLTMLGAAIVLMTGLILIPGSYAGPGGTKIKNPLVIPAPGHISTGYSGWESGTHGVCDVKVKMKDGRELLDNVYGDIYGSESGGFTVIKTDGSGTYDCVSVPKEAPVQSWEKYPDLTMPKGGTLDPSSAVK